MKNSNVRNCWTCSRNKGLSKYRGELASCRQAHPPAVGREAGGRQPELVGEGKSQPQRCILNQTMSRLLVASQVFLGSWMVDIHQEGHSQRSAPQRRHTTHLSRRSCHASRKPSRWDQEVIRCTAHLGECTYQASGCLSCSELGRAHNADPTKSVPLWST